MRLSKRIFSSILAIFFVLIPQEGRAAEKSKTKIVFISGAPSHGPMMHEHRAGNDDDRRAERR